MRTGQDVSRRTIKGILNLQCKDSGSDVYSVWSHGFSCPCEDHRTLFIFCSLKYLKEGSKKEEKFGCGQKTVNFKRICLGG